MKTNKTIGINGMHCAACSSRTEKALSAMPGMISAHVNLALEEASIEYDDKRIKPTDIEQTITRLGFSIRQETVLSDNSHRLAMQEAGKRMLFTWLITILVTLLMLPHMLMGIMLISHRVDSWLLFMLSLVVMIFPARQVYISAYKSIRSGSANMDVLIAIGTLASMLTLPLSYVLKGIPAHAFEGIAAMILAFHLTGRYLEAKARGKASEAIRKLVNLGAKTAIVIIDGKETEVPVHKLQIGDVFIAKPGMKIATDGEIVEGITTIDESMATGESIPVTRKPGDKVIGATLNIDGFVQVKTTRIGNETFLAQVLKMVQDAQHSKVPIQVLADRVTAIFVPVILVLALCTFLAWLVVPDFMQSVSFWLIQFIPLSVSADGLAAAIMAAIATLVIACPCALGLATPTALMVGSGIGAANGVLIRSGEALQTMKDVKCMVFDKTGTLTTGKPELITFHTKKLDNDLYLQIAAALEVKSDHPIARAIVQAARVKGLSIPDVYEFKSISGMGLTGKIENKFYLIGKADLLALYNINPNSTFDSKKDYLSLTTQATNSGSDTALNYATRIYLATENELLATFYVADQLREEAGAVVAELKKRKIRTVMLSGDNEAAAMAIGTQCGIDSVRANVLPADKATEIKKLQAEFGCVAMIGDGINDAPALKTADIGIAMGKGTDVAIEAADITIVRDDLKALLKAINLSVHTFRKIRQNLFWAFFYNLVAIPLAVFGVLHPILAEIAMASSSITVVTNANLLKRKKI